MIAIGTACGLSFWTLVLMVWHNQLARRRDDVLEALHVCHRIVSQIDTRVDEALRSHRLIDALMRDVYADNPTTTLRIAPDELN